MDKFRSKMRCKANNTIVFHSSMKVGTDHEFYSSV